MKDTSYTAKGRSSTWASLWSTSLRSVSGFQMSRQRTNRRRRTAKALVISHGQLYSTICNISLEPDPPIFCCPIWFSVHSEAQSLHVESDLGLKPSLLTLCWLLARKCGRRTMTKSLKWQSYFSASGLMDIVLMSRLCSAPSGGQIEDQHDVHWAIWLHFNCGTLIKTFAAQYILMNSLCWH